MTEPVQKEGEMTPTATPVVVKKYANRRLYNTETSSYVTLDSLAGMVRIGRDFIVYDAKTGEDITRSVLTQIIVEEESKGRALLPTGFLRQLIGFYGNSMQGLVPKYLEHAMENFERQQQQMRASITTTVGSLFPGMEEVSRQNIAMMERAMSLFSPFYPGAEAARGVAGSKADAAAGSGGAHEFSEIETEMSTLRSELEPMRNHLDALSRELTAARERAARVEALEAENIRLRAAIEGSATKASAAPAVAPGAPPSEPKPEPKRPATPVGPAAPVAGARPRRATGAKPH